eukprot:SAG31_NODE_2931_length_4898_cov_2.527818_7_plen_97_part_00
MASALLCCCLSHSVSLQGNAETNNHNDGAGTMEVRAQLLTILLLLRLWAREYHLLVCTCITMLRKFCSLVGQAIYFGSAQGPLNHAGAGKVCPAES